MSVISLPESDAGLAAGVSQHRDRLKAADDLGALANFRMIPELAAAFADVEAAAGMAGVSGHENRRRCPFEVSNSIR